MKIHNWNRWQSYRKDRGQPPWIKVHRCLLRREKWLELTDAERGQVISMWILAADNNGQLPDDPNTIKRLAYLDDLPNFKKLSELGFLDMTPSRRRVDAKPTPSRRQHDAPEADTEAEADTDKPPLPPLKGGGSVQLSLNGFDVFWQAYPRKQGKGDAERAWKQTKTVRPPMIELCTAIDKWKTSDQWKKDGGQYIPLPATWLRGKRWLDEIGSSEPTVIRGLTAMVPR